MIHSPTPSQRTTTTSPTFNYLEDQRSTPTWPRSQLWDRTYDEARFNDLSKKHKDDATWLYNELHATRRRMHQAWTDNHQLSLRLGNSAGLQSELDESNHKLIDLKRSQHNAVRESSELQAQIARLQSRCEGLLITNERLEEFQAQAKLTEQKWVGGLAECESYMKQLCERLEEATKAKNHYKQWSIDRTAQLREAETTLTKMLSELQAAVQQRDAYKKEAEERQHHVEEMADNLAATLDRAKKDAETFQTQAEQLQETIVRTKMELSTSKTTIIQSNEKNEELTNQLQKMEGALTETRDQLKTSTMECTAGRGKLQSTEADLKTTTQLATQLDTKLTKAYEDVTGLNAQVKDSTAKIAELEKTNTDQGLKVEQGLWQLKVNQLEMDRLESVHREQYELYECELNENRARIQQLEKAIAIARAGAQATTVAKELATNNVEQVVSNVLQSQQVQRLQVQQQVREQMQGQMQGPRQQQVQAPHQPFVQHSPQRQQRSMVSRDQFDLDPFAGSRVALREAGYVGKRSVLSDGLLESLQKNVVDYALLSLQRAGPLLDKDQYERRGGDGAARGVVGR